MIHFSTKLCALGFVVLYRMNESPCPVLSYGVGLSAPGMIRINICAEIIRHLEELGCALAAC